MMVGDKVRWQRGAGMATGPVREVRDSRLTRRARDPEVLCDGSPEGPVVVTGPEQLALELASAVARP